MNIPYSMANALDEVDLYVTMECNLKCSFCSVRANEYHNSGLPLKRIIEIISEATDLGMQQLHLTGGEPTLRTDLDEIIRSATKKGVETRLITNGTLLDRNRLNQLQNAGLSNIMVSIDGLEQTHNLMRGSSEAWRKAIDCVQAAIELGIHARMSSVAFQNNIDEIPELIRIANNLGVHIFSVFLGSPLGRGVTWKNYVVVPTAWRAFIELLLAKISKSEYGSHMEIIAEQGFLWPDTFGFQLI